MRRRRKPAISFSRHQRRALRVRADRDAQELLDARQLEVAHDDAALRAAPAPSSGIVPRVAGEDEIGGGGQDLEAERGRRKCMSSADQFFAGGDDGLARLLEVFASSIAATAPAMARRSSG
jgi:hypothetical protein